MKKIIIPTLALIGAFVLGGCSLYGGTSNNSPGAPDNTTHNIPSSSSNTTQSPSVAPSPTQESTVSSNAVNIQGFAFSPATLTVKKGTTVTWTNNDSAPHQIKSATFNSSQLSKGQSFSFTFSNAGTFDYSCSIHPSMLGKIIVE